MWWSVSVHVLLWCVYRSLYVSQFSVICSCFPWFGCIADPSGQTRLWSSWWHLLQITSTPRSCSSQRWAFALYFVFFVMMMSCCCLLVSSLSLCLCLSVFFFLSFFFFSFHFVIESFFPVFLLFFLSWFFFCFVLFCFVCIYFCPFSVFRVFLSRSNSSLYGTIHNMNLNGVLVCLCILNGL